jgi:anaerobic selenocysteine-containing dehydrogenase
MIERLPGLLDDGGGAELRLVSRRHARRVNSAAYAVPELAEREPPIVVLHPEDAVRLGVAEGAPVEVRTDAGAVRGTAHLDDGIRPGAVSLTHGWIAVNVNALVGAHQVDVLTGQPHMSAIPVTVIAAPEGEAPEGDDRSR